MTYYSAQVQRIIKEVYANTAQIDMVISAKKYLDQHYQQDINLGLFKRYRGQTPHRYLIERRIQKAKDCLKKGYSVSDTCYAVGFKSPGTFSNLFKSIVGSSPAAYQRRAIFNMPAPSG